MTTVTIRRAIAEDRPAVLELMRASLGWRESDPNAEFFAWKHEQNPFGASPAWVACSGEQVVGFRTFMRWQFRSGEGSVSAVRAVDTATHPDFQGQGIFSRLTMHAVDELREEGVGFVFNTPNDQSRPGYLKMGWQPVGQLPVAMRLRSVSRLRAVARARTAADLWSYPCDAGVAVDTVLDGPSAWLQDAATTRAASGDVATDLSARYLRWRFGFPALHYRAMLLTDSPADGVAIFRLRRRGAATEAAVVETIAKPEVITPLVRRVLARTRADYAIVVHKAADRPRGVLPMPGQGPLLVWRALADTVPPPLDAWRLSLGDVELF